MRGMCYNCHSVQITFERVGKKMAGKREKKQRGTYRRNMRYILIAVAISLPSVISLFLIYQMSSIQQSMVELKHEVSTLKAEYMTENNQHAAATLVDEVSQEAEQATESVELLESKVLWEDFNEGTQVWNSDTGIRKVYLTFDDGPSANTDKILDILDEYGVKATFFVVGKEDYTAQYQRIVNEGHTLGMHSFSHKYQEIYQSVDSYKEDLMKLHDFLYEITGVDSRCVRFPGGSSNKASKVDMQDLITYLTQQGITYFDWNVSSGDAASGYVSAQRITDNIMSNASKYNSVMILMHDSSAKNTTVEALPGIIEKLLESENTVLLPISEDTLPIQHIEAECQS